MKNYIISVVLLIGSLLTFNMSAQGRQELDTTHQYVYKDNFTFEFLGSFSFYSFNYSRHIKLNQYMFADLKIGAGFFLGPTIPHAGTLNFGKKHHYFEIGYQGTAGLGLEIFEDGLFFPFYIPAAVVGYRYHWKNAYIKVYVSPLYSKGNNPEILPWGGLSCGLRFDFKKLPFVQ